MKSIRRPLFATLLIAISAISTPSFSASTAEKTLNYKEIVVILGMTDEQKIINSLVGKKVSVKLIATGPQSLMVKKRDGVFFSCDKKSPGFKSGQVTATVTNFEITPDGDLSISLDKCGT